MNSHASARAVRASRFCIRRAPTACSWNCVSRMRQITSTMSEAKRRAYINLKLALLGLPHQSDAEWEDMTAALLPRQQEVARLLSDYLNPVDQRIQDYLGNMARLPRRTFVLDRYGLARALSLPP